MTKGGLSHKEFYATVLLALGRPPFGLAIRDRYHYNEEHAKWVRSFFDLVKAAYGGDPNEQFHRLQWYYQFLQGEDNKDAHRRLTKLR